MKTTAKFGTLAQNSSFIDRVHTQVTDNFGRSQIFAHLYNKSSKMDISQLEHPAKKDNNVKEILQHKINGDNPINDGTIYRCPICDRLRAICPYKSYNTYQYCQKCTNTDEQKKHQRPRIFSDATPSFSKQPNSTYAETRGHSINKGAHRLKIFKDNENEHKERNMAEVDKVRFVPTNNVYYLKENVKKTPINLSQYRQASKSNYLDNLNDRPRATTEHLVQRPTATFQPVINQTKILPAPSNTEEIIFYPVIHNKLVYKSGGKGADNVEELNETVNINRSRYQSHFSERKSKRQVVNKAVSDFLNTTKPDEILTPFQFKKLADSIYRQVNPNIDEE